MSDSTELINTDDEASSMGVDVISLPTDVKEGFSVANIEDVPSMSADVRYSDTDDAKAIGSDDAIFPIDDGDAYILVIELSSVDIIGLFISAMSVVCIELSD